MKHPVLTFSTKFALLGRSKKRDGRLGLWLAETFSTSPLKPLNRIRQNLTGSKIATSSTKYMFFRPIGKTRWPPGLWFAKTFSTSPWKPLNRIQRNFIGSKISMSATKFVFRVDRKNKLATLASDWLSHFRLNLWTELNETWQEARCQRPLSSLCFLGDWKNKMAALANPSKRGHIVLRCTICGLLGLLFIIRAWLQSMNRL